MYGVSFLLSRIQKYSNVILTIRFNYIYFTAL